MTFVIIIINLVSQKKFRPFSFVYIQYIGATPLGKTRILIGW